MQKTNEHHFVSSVFGDIVRVTDLKPRPSRIFILPDPRGDIEFWSRKAASKFEPHAVLYE